GGQPLWITATK
nr:autotaxin [human, Peptide Partial, 11 aa] [Homo sapiens]